MAHYGKFLNGRAFIAKEFFSSGKLAANHGKRVQGGRGFWGSFDDGDGFFWRKLKPGVFGL